MSAYGPGCAHQVVLDVHIGKMLLQEGSEGGRYFRSNHAGCVEVEAIGPGEAFGSDGLRESSLDVLQAHRGDVGAAAGEAFEFPAVGGEYAPIALSGAAFYYYYHWEAYKI